MPEESPGNMLFDGQELREIIARTPNEIELRNEYGRCRRILSQRRGARLGSGPFYRASETGAAFDFCAVGHSSLHSTPEATQRSA